MTFEYFYYFLIHYSFMCASVCGWVHVCVCAHACVLLNAHAIVCVHRTEDNLQLLIFSFSSIFAGLAGAFYAHYVGFIDPSSFSADQSIQILSMIILGGMGNIYGSILGALSLTALPELLRPLLSMRQVLYGALLVVMVLIRPQGILGKINLKHLKQQHGSAENETEEGGVEHS